MPGAPSAGSVSSIGSYAWTPTVARGEKGYTALCYEPQLTLQILLSGMGHLAYSNLYRLVMANTGHADSYAGEMISGIVSREPRGYSCFGDVNRAGNLGPGAGRSRHLNVPPGLARDKPEPYQKWGITSAALIARLGMSGLTGFWRMKSAPALQVLQVHKSCRNRIMFMGEEQRGRRRNISVIPVIVSRYITDVGSRTQIHILLLALL
ncbi:hypothetical protein BCR43DRAFT_509334 [Syncephalastrum racemosum]|uniref:Uncharacterized protein n=1 Tax=Syncephalastrum racemosum TaxID=13706 RepID=A0A1X2GYR5_SYNRA|nr:hypothetical protein BCR43DRAFT_509334 [Syncephalastrum racemosum]